MANAYATRADINGLGEEFFIPTSWIDADVSTLITNVEAEVNDLTEDDFSQVETVTLVADGEGSSVLNLKRYDKRPLRSVTSIIWRASTVDSFSSENAWATSDFVVHLHYLEASGAELGVPLHFGQIGHFGRGINNLSLGLSHSRSLTRAIFVRGIQNYQIIGGFGHSTVPKQITYLTVLLARERIQPGYLNQLNMESISWSDFKFTVGSTRKKIPTFTGYPVLDVIIAKYATKAFYLTKV